MANTQIKGFKGFKFIGNKNLSIKEILAKVSGDTQTMYFVRTNGFSADNLNGTDGYIVFNGKAYGTGDKLSGQIADINTAINDIVKVDGTIDSKIKSLDATKSGSSTDNYVTVQVEQTDGKLSSVTVTDAGLVDKLTAIESAISDITGDNGTIDTKITNAINALNSTIQTTGTTYIDSTIKQEDGKLKSITLDETKLSNVIKGINDKINDLNATVSDSSDGGHVSVEIVQANGKLTGVTVTSNVNDGNLAIPETTSDKTGLVTAGQVENFVKTSVADLAGAMHFVGTTTVDPITITGTTYKSGDVIINTANNKEYIYNGTTWVELGDEGLYVTKATTIAGVDLQNDITKEELLSNLNVADGAQVNVIEKVKVNDKELSITDKTVNVTITEGTANGTVKVNGTDVNVHGLGSAAYTNSDAYDASGTAAQKVAEISGTTSGTSTNYSIAVTTTQSNGKIDSITVNDSALKDTITVITNDISTLNTNAVKNVNGKTGNDIVLTGGDIAVGANVNDDGDITAESKVSEVLTDIYTKIGALSSAAYTGITSTGKTLTISGEGTTQNVEVNLKADVDPGFIQLMKDETTGAIYGAMYYDGEESVLS